MIRLMSTYEFHTLSMCLAAETCCDCLRALCIVAFLVPASSVRLPNYEGMSRYMELHFHVCLVRYSAPPQFSQVGVWQSHMHTKLVFNLTDSL